jgi:hypothetical protein
MKKTKYISMFTVLASLIIAGCSTDNMDTETVAEYNSGPFYNEFMACKTGPDFSMDKRDEMMSAWRDLSVSDDLMGSWGYAPFNDATAERAEQFSADGWWELQWTSKEAAEAAWVEFGSSEEAAAWSAKYESVLDCDGPGRFAWDFYQPSPSDTYGEFDESGYFASFYQECTVNEGQTPDDIRAVVAKFEEYLESAASFGPYTYGLYFPASELSENANSSDLLWGNFFGTFEGAEKGFGDYEVNGKEMQADFDKVMICGDNDVWHTQTLYDPTNPDLS